MQTIDLLRTYREHILAAAARHGARNVRVFGSVARGEDDARSDIDLLVDFASDRSLFDLAGLQIDIESLLGRHADIVTEKSVSALLRERILGEARAL